MAKLIFNYGAMSSGKTIEVIETAYKYNSKGMKALLLKPKIDTKGNNKVISRIGLEKEVDKLILPRENIISYVMGYGNVKCVVVDEAQFLTEKQVYQLVIITKKLGIPIICYGLKVDFQGKLFKGSEALIRYADEINELKALCKCGNIARFNARKINGKYVYDGKQIVIGEDETYEPMCEKCFLEQVLLKESKDFKQIMKEN